MSDALPSGRDATFASGRKRQFRYSDPSMMGNKKKQKKKKNKKLPAQKKFALLVIS